MLLDIGVDTVLADQGHYELAVSPQSWRWNAREIAGPSSKLLDAQIDVRERSTPVIVQALDQTRQYRCLIRDNRTVQNLSFGTRGAIHAASFERVDEIVLDLAAALRLGLTVTLADDGDRINPMSLPGYEHFLESLPQQASLVGNVRAEQRGPALEYLPSYALPGFEELLRDGQDSSHYLQLLDELYRKPGAHRKMHEILALQDIFFLFWKTVSRKRFYVEGVLRLLHELDDDAPNETIEASENG
jgi:hypothetical protein